MAKFDKIDDALEILIVAATPLETQILRTCFAMPEAGAGQASRVSVKEHGLSLLHTGIGMVNTSYHLGRFLMNNRPELAIQIGIAGTFLEELPMAEVVEVETECYAELGAHAPSGFLGLKSMGFENFRAPSGFYYNEIQNPQGKQTRLISCRGITVNAVHGTRKGIDQVKALWQPEVESMEGAAFFQCCLMDEVPFLQLRGISNLVEPRNREAWKIREAAESVQRFCLDHLQNTILKV